MQSQPGTEGGHRDQVMTATVPDLGEGVVFGQDGHHRAVSGSSLERGPEGGFDAANSAFHGKPVVLQRAGQKLSGVMFLVVEFGMGVYVQGDPEQLFPSGIYGCGGKGLFGRIVAECHGNLDLITYNGPVALTLRPAETRPGQ